MFVDIEQICWETFCMCNYAEDIFNYRLSKEFYVAEFLNVAQTLVMADSKKWKYTKVEVTFRGTMLYHVLSESVKRF